MQERGVFGAVTKQNKWSLDNNQGAVCGIMLQVCLQKLDNVGERQGTQSKAACLKRYKLEWFSMVSCQLKGQS